MPSLWQRQKKIIIAIVVIAILAVGSVSAALLLRPPQQFTIPLWYNSDGHYGDTEPTVAQVIASAIEKTGKINVQLKSEPWAQYTTDFGNGNLPFFLLGWYPDYFDADDYASPFLGTAGAASLGSEYSNQTMDNWLAWEAGNSSSTARSQLFTQIQTQLANDVPYIPLWEGKANIVYKNGINNVFLHPVAFRYGFMSNTNNPNTLNVGTTDRIKSLDPAYAYDYFSIEIINQVFDTLLVYSPTNTTLLPGLATTIPTVANGLVSSDLKTWTFPLRTGVTFSDGSVLNSTVVKKSIIRAITLNLPGSASFLLSQVGALGNTTSTTNPANTINIDANPTNVTFHLHSPVGFFNQLMAFSVSAPVKVVGSGPYKLTAYTQDQSLTLAKNPTYFGIGIYASTGFPSVPSIGTVNIKTESTATQLKNDIVAGAIDMAYRTLNPQDITSLQIQAQSLGLKVDFGASPQIRYLVFNVKTAPFNNVLLRRAIAYAVDRSLIINNVFNSQVDPLWSMIPTVLNYSIPVFQLIYGSVPNLTQAGNLLTQFGLSIFATLDISKNHL